MLQVINSLTHLYEAVHHSNKMRQLQPAERKLERDMAKAFRAQGKAFMVKFSKLKPSFPPEVSERGLRAMVQLVGHVVLKEAISDAMLNDAFDASEGESMEMFIAPLSKTVEAMLSTGARHLLGELNLKMSFDLKNPRAVSYLQAHGAELVANVNQTTRDYIRTLVAQAVEEGWSYDVTARALIQRYAEFAEGRPQDHIDSRAHGIAVTEAGQAYEEGNYIVTQDLKDGGIDVVKMWDNSHDSKVCEVCEGNSNDGWIPVDEAHSSGDMHPMAHPYDRCDELYETRS